MGPEEGEPVVYYWPVYYHFAWLLIPLLLLMLLLRAVNRRSCCAWLLLLAILLLSLGNMWGIGQIGIFQVFSFVFDSLAIYLFGMSFLWLLSDNLLGRTHASAFLRALLILAVAGVIGLIGVSGFGLGLILIPIAIAYGFMTFVALVAILLAGLACRQRYSPPRYLVWLFIICVPGIGGVLAVLIGFLMLLSGIFTMGALSLQEVMSLFGSALTSGLISGGVIFLLVLPFMAMALYSPVFCPRFHAIFRLPGMEFTPDEEYNDGVQEAPEAGQDPSGDII